MRICLLSCTDLAPRVSVSICLCVHTYIMNLPSSYFLSGRHSYTLSLFWGAVVLKDRPALETQLIGRKKIPVSFADLKTLWCAVSAMPRDLLQTEGNSPDLSPVLSPQEGLTRLPQSPGEPPLASFGPMPAYTGASLIVALDLWGPGLLTFDISQQEVSNLPE